MVFQRASNGNIETEEKSEAADAPIVMQATVSEALAHSASGPSLCSTSHASFRERPHTVSSAYGRTLSRPPVTARTFEPPYGFVKAQASTSVYATPTNLHRQTADIYARPTLCGRRFSQGAVAVAPPVVPSHYAACQNHVRNAGRSTDTKSTVSDEEGEITQGHIHRSSSLPSPVHSDVCEFSVLQIIMNECKGEYTLVVLFRKWLLKRIFERTFPVCYSPLILKKPLAFIHTNET